MKRIIQSLALLVAVGAVTLWAGTGAHGGWTKTSVPVKTLDEVTGIEGITYQKRFVPGVDFLGSALLSAAILAVLSLFFDRHPKTGIKPIKP